MATYNYLITLQYIILLMHWNGYYITHERDDGGRIWETQRKVTTSRRAESLDTWTCRGEADDLKKKTLLYQNARNRLRKPLRKNGFETCARTILTEVCIILTRISC